MREQIETRPIAIDLFCGLGGWTEGLLAEGYDVIGFDIEQHAYGDQCYPGMLCIQDVLTLHGSQFKNATLIVASPPCQEYSYMAMPWSLAKAKAAAIRADTTGQKLADLTRLFNACFRIQKEASLAAGCHIPMVVENVGGAQPWVGQSRGKFGSFHLWGDVPALMPMVSGRSVMKAGITHRGNGSTNFHGHKVPGISWSGHGQPGYKPKGFNVTAAQRFRDEFKKDDSGTKVHKSGRAWFAEGIGSQSSKSDSRKAASAMIAKIPMPLSRHIAAVYHP